MYKARYDNLILCLRIIGWICIAIGIVMFIMLLLGRANSGENTGSYIAIIISGILSGPLFLGFAALLEHQADIEELEYKQSQFLKAILENTKSAKDASNSTLEN